MSLITGMIFEGPCEFKNNDFNIRIIIKNVSGNDIETSNEIWVGNFMINLETSIGNGNYSTLDGNRVQMNWKDQATEFEGVYEFNNKTLTGKFTQYQGGDAGKGADFVLILKE